MNESNKIAQLRDRLANIENNSVEPLSEWSLPPGTAALATKIGTTLGDVGTKIGTKALDLGADAVQGVKKFFTKPLPTLSQTSKFTLNGKDYFAQPGLGGNGIKWFTLGADKSEKVITNPSVIAQLEAEAIKHETNLVRQGSPASDLLKQMFKFSRNEISNAQRTPEVQQGAEKLSKYLNLKSGGAIFASGAYITYKAIQEGNVEPTWRNLAFLMQVAGVIGMMWPVTSRTKFVFLFAVILLAGGAANVPGVKSFTAKEKEEILKYAKDAYLNRQEPNKAALDEINPDYYDAVKQVIDDWKTRAEAEKANSTANTPAANPSAAGPKKEPAAPPSNNRDQIDALRKELGL
jgi:hypothetical protein